MQVTHFDLGRPIPGGFLDGTDGFWDRIEVDPGGILRIVGWSKSRFKSKMVPRVSLDAEGVPFLQHYRVARPDVSESLSKLVIPHFGLVLEYLVPESMAARPFQSISVMLNDNSCHRFEGLFEFVNPHYRGLFESEWVYHRVNIYGSGPPNPIAQPEALELAKQLSDPILDFGCGSGALIQELQRAGLNAQGLELDTPMIRESLYAANRSSVTLYDGRFPSPFPSGSFKSVFCSEVLEHIPDFESAIRDIARLATEKVMFTVPDASAIPTGFRHTLVPWHLLEGTHVNFFTQTSLTRALQPHFSRIEFGRVGACRMNDSLFHVSLVAVCLK
ncbi:MAG: class I SAM-dependent methyltransferase [Bryobacteraceae bacterium]